MQTFIKPNYIGYIVQLSGRTWLGLARGPSSPSLALDGYGRAPTSAVFKD